MVIYVIKKEREDIIILRILLAVNFNSILTNLKSFIYRILCPIESFVSVFQLEIAEKFCHFVLMFKRAVWSRLILVDGNWHTYHGGHMYPCYKRTQKSTRVNRHKYTFFLWLWPFWKGTLKCDWSSCKECWINLPTFLKCMGSYLENINCVF